MEHLDREPLAVAGFYGVHEATATLANDINRCVRVEACREREVLVHHWRDTSVRYAPLTDLAHRRALPTAIDRGGLTSKIDYPDADTTIETDERGIVTTTTYNAWRQPVHIVVTGPGQTLDQSWTYDANGRVATEKRRQGSEDVTTSFQYDVLGRQTLASIDHVAVGGSDTTLTSTTAYDISSHKITTTAPSGAVTRTSLDELGRTAAVHTETGVDPIDQTFAYDLDDHQVYGTDGFSASAAAYDGHGRQIATRMLDGTGSAATYDALGRAVVAETRDAAGAVTAHSDLTFTPAGRLQSMTTKVDTLQSRTTSFGWDGAGRTTGSATEGRAQHATFDVAGRIRDAVAGAGSSAAVTTIFDHSSFASHTGALPTLVLHNERTGATYRSTSEYDTLGMANRTTVGTLEWNESHDEAGNVVTAADPNRPPASFDTDARGAVTKETLPDGASIAHRYHETGAESAYIDQTDQPTATENDKLGRPLSRTYADGTTETTTYQGPRLVATKDRQGRIQKYDYNDKDQITAITPAAPARIEGIVARKGDVLPGGSMATVVDGDGRLIMVDLSRLDERYGPDGLPIKFDDLFPTVARALLGKGATGAGVNDPRIVWASDPGLVSGTLAPVADSSTGILFAGNVMARTTNVVSATDPHLVIRANTGGP